jgi:monovalent cation/hydrogen antiporter
VKKSLVPNEAGLPVLNVLTFVLAAMAVIVVLQYLADRTGLPTAALLTVAGLVYGVLPGPNVTLDPHVILTFVIPPLIYSAALNSSLLAIRENMRTVISLSIGLVLATAVVTGIGMDLFVPGVGLAAGIALGAALSPTDPVAALAVGGRAGLPPKLITIIEGEGLLNDATALTTLTVAVTAATSGGFSFGGAVLRFLLSAAGGLLCGVAVAIIVRLLRSVVRDPLLVNGVSLATPFAAYLIGEDLHVSGVLAVAVAGLMIGHETPRFTSGASRLQATAVWHLADFLLQGFVFLLVGQQIAPVIRGLKAYPTGTIVAAVAISLGVVLLLRPLWLAVTQSLPRALRHRQGRDIPDDQYLSGREIGVLSWAGTRGVISLAAIFTLPLTIEGGRPFPGRDLLLFCTYLVVVVTLVGQGLTFAPIARALGVHADPADAALVRTQARAASVQAGLSRLDQIAEDDAVPGPVLAALRASLDAKARRYRLLLDRLETEEDSTTGAPDAPGTSDYEAALHARRAVIDAQREELLRWRDAGHLPDASLRILERELDHEERTLPPHDGH